MKKEIADVQAEVWEIAEQNGFHDDDRSRAKVIALIHSECSEALEADRAGESDREYGVELADIIIRVLDHAEEEGINLQQLIEEKNEKNRQRAYKHGKKY